MQLPLYYYLLLMFIAPMGSDTHKYDMLAKKLNGTTWIIVKECIGDTCHSVNDTSQYYHFSKTAFSYTEAYKTMCGGYNHYEFIYDPVSNTVVFSHVSCSPFICITGVIDKNKYKIDIWSERDGKRVGELKFIADDEFTLSPVAGFSKQYYMIVATPKEIVEE